MDDQHRRTLYLMASLVDRLSVKDAGYQLILIAKDFIEAGEVLEARKYVAEIPPLYFDEYIQYHVTETTFAQAVAILIDTFGPFLNSVKPLGSS